MRNKLFRLFSFFLTFLFFFMHAALPALAAVSYLYDANGNMTSDSQNCYTYNEANRLSQVKNCSTNQLVAEYFYDFQGNRVKEKEYTNGVLAYTIYNPSKDYETKKLADNSTQNTTYYHANDQIIARKNSDGSNTYYQNDHLGSTGLLTNQSGAMVENTTYYPYGEIRSGGTLSKYLFTGKQKDTETGLTYFGSRYYNSHIQRFAQPDTLLPDVYDPQQLNRYAYVRNNPLRYTDPTGHNLIAFGLALLAVVYVFVVAPATIHNNQNNSNQTSNVITSVVSVWNSAASTVHSAFSNMAKTAPVTQSKQSTSSVTTQSSSTVVANKSTSNNPGKQNQSTKNNSPENNNQNRNPKQDMKLNDGEIKRLQKGGIDPEEIKGGDKTGRWDLFKDKEGNIRVKPKNGSGEGEETGYNINDY